MLYARHRAAVVTRLSYLIGPSAGIEDLVQDTFLRAFRSLARFRGECPFRAWLLRIATHAARTEHRSLGRRLWRLFTSEAEELAQEPAHGAEAERYAELRALYEALDHLSPRLREAVVLFDLEERTLAELALELDVPLHTIAARVRRGREALRRALEAPTRLRRTLVPCAGELP